jgi:hypothetical protein
MTEQTGVLGSEASEGDSKSYRYRISLRVWHPSLDPDQITASFGINPNRSWRAGEARETPKATSLVGINKTTYWTAEIDSGSWPDRTLRDVVKDVLDEVHRQKSFFRQLRLEGGSVELFIGWFFEGQSGDVLSHDVLALAGDLQIDLSFDVYPSAQSQDGRAWF